LKALLEEADERNRAMALLNDMVDVLQSCRTSAEVFEAIGHFVPRFFPIDAGALYLLRNSKNLLSSVTSGASHLLLRRCFLRMIVGPYAAAGSIRWTTPTRPYCVNMSP
jgi:hypothetical protein